MIDIQMTHMFSGVLWVPGRLQRLWNGLFSFSGDCNPPEEGEFGLSGHFHNPFSGIILEWGINNGILEGNFLDWGESQTPSPEPHCLRHVWNKANMRLKMVASSKTATTYVGALALNPVLCIDATTVLALTILDGPDGNMGHVFTEMRELLDSFNAEPEHEVLQ